MKKQMIVLGAGVLFWSAMQVQMAEGADCYPLYFQKYEERKDQYGEGRIREETNPFVLYAYGT